MDAPKLSFEKFSEAAIRADATVKRHNGHQFEHILKTRCMWCHRSPKAKGRCSSWFQTFLFQLAGELTGTFGTPRAQ